MIKGSITDAEMLAMAAAFDLIPYDPRCRVGTIAELRVVRRRTNPEAWAIVSRGSVLMRDGMWAIEPQPSSRDDSFLADTRWPTAREAIAFAREHMAQNPTGYTQEHRDLCWGPRSTDGA